MMSARKNLPLLIGVVFMLSSLGCVDDPTNVSLPDDRKTALPVVEAHLRALSQGDPDASFGAAGGISPASGDKDDRLMADAIKKYRNIDFTRAKITIVEGTTPWIPIALVEVQSDEQPPSEWMVNLYWDDEGNNWIISEMREMGNSGPRPPVSGPTYKGPDPTVKGPNYRDP